MLSFKQTMGGYEVAVNGESFGHISQEHGFFTDPTVVKKFIEVPSTDLRELAEKVELVKLHGYLPAF